MVVGSVGMDPEMVTGLDVEHTGPGFAVVPQDPPTDAGHLPERILG